MSNWYEEIPYGPLTYDDFINLQASFYLGSMTAAREVAIQRGLDKDLEESRLGKIQTGQSLIKVIYQEPKEVSE